MLPVALLFYRLYPRLVDTIANHHLSGGAAKILDILLLLVSGLRLFRLALVFVITGGCSPCFPLVARRGASSAAALRFAFSP